MWRAFAMWSIGSVIKNPLAVGIAAILLGTPSGRTLLKIAVVETIGFNYRVGSRIGVEIIAPRAREAWAAVGRPAVAGIVANPIAAGLVVTAVAGAVGAHQSMSNLGSGIRIGEIQPVGAVAPSHHLVGGRPWWE